MKKKNEIFLQYKEEIEGWEGGRNQLTDYRLISFQFLHSTCVQRYTPAVQCSDDVQSPSFQTGRVVTPSDLQTDAERVVVSQSSLAPHPPQVSMTVEGGWGAACAGKPQDVITITGKLLFVWFALCFKAEFHTLLQITRQNSKKCRFCFFVGE